MTDWPTKPTCLLCDASEKSSLAFALDDFSGKESTYQLGDTGGVGSIPGSGRYPGVESGNPPVSLLEKFHGQKSLVCYSPWGLQKVRYT